MKYLKYFELTSAYEAYKNGSNYILPNVSYILDTHSVAYDPMCKGPDIRDNYLTIEALEDGLTASLSLNACEYCVDGDGNWKSLAAGTATEVINTGQTLSFRAELTPTLYTGIGTFTISKKCNLKGNCMSMLFGDNAVDKTTFTDAYAFYRLFYNNTYIINVSSNFLPATTLADYCYYYMFYGCTGLTTPPALPATTLANYCYSQMFRGCTSLTTTPALPATTLANSCYAYMFSDCTSLTTAPDLPATTLANNCYNGMFWNCTKLTSAPALPATTLADSCYNAMFSRCTKLTSAPALPATALKQRCYFYMFDSCFSLIQAPELPATTLADYCYSQMFSSCVKLTSAPALPATTLASNCYANMFQGCTSLTQAPTVLPATTLADYCYSCMFSGCSLLTTAPELPATTLADYCYKSMFSTCVKLTSALTLPATTLANHCYESMFYGCTNLNYIKMLATDVSADEALRGWVANVAPTGTFVKLANTELPIGTNGIPDGWTVINEGLDQSPDASDPEYTATAPVGASISIENNSKFYTAESWATSGKTLDDVDGIAISNGEYSFMIHPTTESKTLKWGLDNVAVGNDDRISGYYMTNKIAESVNYDPTYAATYCQDTTFTNGSSGYLMNESEFRMAYEYIDDINACLAAIGGTEFALKSKNYWTCVEADSNMAKYWAYLKADFDKNPKSYKTPWVRPAAPITVV